LKPVYLESSNGYPISFTQGVEGRRATRIPGTTLYAGIADGYLIEGKVEVNLDTFSDTCYLWYLRRVADPICGTAAAGAATSITIPSSMSPSKVDDYYNGVSIEVASGTGADTRVLVSDYVGSTRVLTLASGTFDTTTIFGSVSELPVEADDYIILLAASLCMVKPASSVAQEYYGFIHNELKEAKKMFQEAINAMAASQGYMDITQTH